MMRANTRANTILRRDDGQIYGIVLGADYVGQHECGIGHLQRLFGMEGGLSGFTGHGATYDASDRVALQTISPRRHVGRRKIEERALSLSTGRRDPEWLADILRRYEEDPIVAAWDDGDFAIAAYGDEAEETVRLIHEGIQTIDVAMWIGGTGGNPFARGGLAIARPSLTPEHLKETFDAAQKDRRDLQAAADETGIRERIIASVRSRMPTMPFFALSPTWTHDARRGETAHPVMFWLNPVDSRRDNHGYFTVEELDQWIERRGPIPKEAA